MNVLRAQPRARSARATARTRRPSDAERRDERRRPARPRRAPRRVQAEEQRAGAREAARSSSAARPGVGKTYAMLEVARRLARRGRRRRRRLRRDARPRRDRRAARRARGAAAPAGRATADARSRSSISTPRSRAAPQVLLLDELAHTNAPGSRHAKRWQDVDGAARRRHRRAHDAQRPARREPERRGRADHRTSRVRETVPDAILERADEIELVDLPPEELLAAARGGQGLRPGAGASAPRGTSSSAGNLLALRELALRRTAERVDAEVQAYRAQHGHRGDLARAASASSSASGPSPALGAAGARGAAHGGRAARALGRGLRRAPAAAPLCRGRSRAARDATCGSPSRSAARSSAARATRPPRRSSSYARKHNVTRIVVGKPTHPRWRDLVRGSLLDEVVRGSGDIDVHVISGERRGRRPRRRRADGPRRRRRRRRRTRAVSSRSPSPRVARRRRCASGVDLADIAMLYLVAIAIDRGASGPRAVAPRVRALGRRPSTSSSCRPIYTFAVSDLRHLLTFAMMFGAGVVISDARPDRIRRQTAAARERERRTRRALRAHPRARGRAGRRARSRTAAARQIRELFGAAAVAARARPDGAQRALVAGCAPRSSLAEPRRTRRAVGRSSTRKPAGRGTDTLPGRARARVPLLAEGGRSACSRSLPTPETRFADPSQRHLLDTFVAPDRARARARAARRGSAHARALRAEAEEMRSSLLSAVSHDLRTPLAVDHREPRRALRDGRPSSTPRRSGRAARRRSATKPARLERLVGEPPRHDAARVGRTSELKKRVGAARGDRRLGAERGSRRRLDGRAVRTERPEPDALIAVDPVLFEQVLVNLLENAVKYTPAGHADRGARARRDAGIVEIEVADRGPGLPPGDEARIFEKFYRGAQPGERRRARPRDLPRHRARRTAARSARRIADGGGAVVPHHAAAVGEAPPRSRARSRSERRSSA